MQPILRDFVADRVHLPSKEKVRFVSWQIWLTSRETPLKKSYWMCFRVQAQRSLSFIIIRAFLGADIGSILGRGLTCTLLRGKVLMWLGGRMTPLTRTTGQDPCLEVRMILTLPLFCLRSSPSWGRKGFLRMMKWIQRIPVWLFRSNQSLSDTSLKTSFKDLSLTQRSPLEKALKTLEKCNMLLCRLKTRLMKLLI